MNKTDIPGIFNAGATLGPVNETNMTRIWNKHKQSNTHLKRKVFVAMSGGIDSSVAAALLKQVGFEVVGVFMKFWSEANPQEGICSQNRCCSPESETRARNVALKLGIPFYVFNFEKEFKKRIVDYFLAEYKKGNTPNPCVVCNKEIKFGLLLEKSLELNADYVATGHYAGIQKKIIKEKQVLYSLISAKDKAKDQSYFLWQLSQSQLKRVLFPLDNLTKPEVVKLAKKLKLPLGGVPESMEVCFVSTTVNEFLGRHLKLKPGKIVNNEGKALGQHKGLWFYTIGQRKGLGLFGSKPFYVLEKDVKNNVLIVTQNKKYLLKKELAVKKVNWISGQEPSLPLKVLVKIRYRHNLAPAKICKMKDKNIGRYGQEKKYKIIFNSPQSAATTGQSAVLYLPFKIKTIGNKKRKDSDKIYELLGGGIIC